MEKKSDAITLDGDKRKLGEPEEGPMKKQKLNMYDNLSPDMSKADKSHPLELDTDTDTDDDEDNRSPDKSKAAAVEEEEYETDEEFEKECAERNIDEMTDEELLSPLDVVPQEKARAFEVIDILRKYIKQTRESDGFDIVDYPGYVACFMTFIPQVCSRELQPEKYQIFELAARLGIHQYNIQHPETEFKVVDVEKATMMPSLTHLSCKVTFTARDKKASGYKDETTPLKTFQAAVTVYKLPLDPGEERGLVHFCRVKA